MVARDAQFAAHVEELVLNFRQTLDHCIGQPWHGQQNAERSEHAAWVRRLSAELADGDPGAYAGLLADEGSERVRAAYPGATWRRLAAVKATYDPDNVFRLNQNIPPEA